MSTIWWYKSRYSFLSIISLGLQVLKNQFTQITPGCTRRYQNIEIYYLSNQEKIIPELSDFSPPTDLSAVIFLFLLYL
jgi:hypothetical protein